MLDVAHFFFTLADLNPHANELWNHRIAIDELFLPLAVIGQITRCVKKNVPAQCSHCKCSNKKCKIKTSVTFFLLL